MSRTKGQIRLLLSLVVVVGVVALVRSLWWTAVGMGLAMVTLLAMLRNQEKPPPE
jgi:uncharacterized protein (UPF0333 family)